MKSEGGIIMSKNKALTILCRIFCSYLVEFSTLFLSNYLLYFRRNILFFPFRYDIIEFVISHGGIIHGINSPWLSPPPN